MTEIAYLIRNKPDPDKEKYGTWGVIVHKDFQCDSLERPWRNNRPGLSCIPPGRYKMSVVQAVHPKGGRRDLYLLQDVPGRTECMIHAGNWAGDTELGLKSNSLGCILPGEKYPGDDIMIHNSQMNTNALMASLDNKPAILVVCEDVDAFVREYAKDNSGDSDE